MISIDLSTDRIIKERKREHIIGDMIPFSLFLILQRVYFPDIDLEKTGKDLADGDVVAENSMDV